jgi:hypothetical protein
MTADEEAAIPTEHRGVYLEHRALCAAIIQRNPYGALMGGAKAAWMAVLADLHAAGFFVSRDKVPYIQGRINALLKLHESGESDGYKMDDRLVRDTDLLAARG